MSEPLKRIIERQEPTPASGTRGRWSASPLPDDLLAEQTQRLALFSAIGAGLWTFGNVMDRLTRLAPAAGLAGYDPSRSGIIELLGVANSLAMFAYVRFSRHGSQRKSDVGLAYMIVNAFLVATMNTWAAPARQLPMHLSWVAVVILVYAMIAPTTPRRIAVASVIAASMDPLAVWLAYIRGAPVPSAFEALLMSLPNYVCAAVAVLPSRLVGRLSHHIRRARELGSYQLLEPLGRGGMGEVWRAQHRLLARTAAIKLVRPEVLGAGHGANTKTVLRRFEREAQATAALSSPHSIRLFDYGMANDGTFYYVMELLTGRDLESLVREFGPLPPDRTVYLLRQASHSLADAHARGLVHRDIKPANIYVCRMGLDYDFVKVLDFGLVKFRDRVSGDTLITAEHTTTGTPGYMAPEVILGEADVDRRADVYALGCVAYFLLTGQLVFEADTVMKMLLSHVHESPVPPSQRTELRIPRELDELVLACLQKDPNRRPQDAEQLFDLAHRYTSCDGWSAGHARTWWETHLPELTGPLVLLDTPQVATGRQTVGV